jgi:hypothetical protein
MVRSGFLNYEGDYYQRSTTGRIIPVVRWVVLNTNANGNRSER